MITILAIIGGVIALASIYLVVTSLAHAPEGYEDENGFHLKSDVPAPVTAVLVEAEPQRRATRAPRRKTHEVPATPIGAH